MTTIDRKRILEKNLDYLTKFNVYIVNQRDSGLLPKGASVVFTDKHDDLFTSVNRELAASIVEEGETCYIAEHKSDRNWNVFPYKLVTG